MTWTAQDHFKEQIRDLAAAQCGLLTAEQLFGPRAAARSLLNALSRAGELLPLEAGVYLHAAHTMTPETQPLAAYIATQAHRTLLQRYDDDSVIVAGGAAAWAWSLDGLLQDTVIRSRKPVPRRRRFHGVRYETAEFPRAEISHRFRYPTPTLERVLADSLQLDGDLEHVAEAMQSALWQHSVDVAALQAMVERTGSVAMDGPATWRYLVAEVGGFPHHDGYPYPIRPWVGRRLQPPVADSMPAARDVETDELSHGLRAVVRRYGQPASLNAGRAEPAEVEQLHALDVLVDERPTRSTPARLRPHRANQLRRVMSTRRRRPGGIGGSEQPRSSSRSRQLNS